jgi:hypothetical protein
LSFKSSLYILDSKTLVDGCYASIFFLSVACFIILLRQRLLFII